MKVNEIFNKDMGEQRLSLELCKMILSKPTEEEKELFWAAYKAAADFQSVKLQNYMQ